MGTRGTFGFRVDGKDYLTYNHYDSYPDYLGKIVVDFANSIKNVEEVKEKVRNLEDISNRKPTEEDIKRCEKTTNLNVSEQDTQDWYCLLRETQGNPESVLEIGLFESANDFINYSLFCEYGYIINLDEETIEFYKGFQDKKHNKGRYAKNKVKKSNLKRTYYPCALVKTYPLNNIPENWIEELS